jgi:hypothetical protein
MRGAACAPACGTVTAQIAKKPHTQKNLCRAFANLVFIVNPSQKWGGWKFTHVSVQAGFNRNSAKGKNCGLQKAEEESQETRQVCQPPQSPG